MISWEKSVNAALMGAAIAFVCVLSSPSRAGACSCAELPLEQRMSSADAVFEAHVLSIAPSEGGVEVAEVAVVQKWKGIETERATVLTGAPLATPPSAAVVQTCNAELAAGLSYLVFASRRDDGRYVTGLCSARRIEASAQDLQHLGAGVTPVEIRDEPEAAERGRAPEPARAGCASCNVMAKRDASWGLAGVVAVLASVLFKRRKKFA